MVLAHDRSDVYGFVFVHIFPVATSQQVFFGLVDFLGIHPNGIFLISFSSLITSYIRLDTSETRLSTT